TSSSSSRASWSDTCVSGSSTVSTTLRMTTISISPVSGSRSTSICLPGMMLRSNAWASASSRSWSSCSLLRLRSAASMFRASTNSLFTAYTSLFGCRPALRPPRRLVVRRGRASVDEPALAGLVRPLGQTGLLDVCDGERALLAVHGEGDGAVLHPQDPAGEALAAGAELHEEVVEALEVARRDQRPLRARGLDLELVGALERVEPVELEAEDLRRPGDVRSEEHTSELQSRENL